MYVVTGGAGFIGSNLVKGLNDRGIDNIVVVDDLSDGIKCRNLADCDIADFIDKETFLSRVNGGDAGFAITALFHEGACSSTTEWNGKFVMEVNYDYSKVMLHYCLDNRVPFSYASSASVYGDGPVFKESRENERPLNMYAFSKFQFDQYVRRLLPNANSQVAGFRYFNVYGPREAHKGSMSSVAFHLRNQILAGENPKLFGAHDGYEAGGQSRDFIYVADVVSAKLWFLDNPASGIFNLGTGRAEPFRAVAEAVINYCGRGEIEYIDFPENLKGRYQSFTQADIGALRAAGCQVDFKTVSQGVAAYMEWLDDNG